MLYRWIDEYETYGEEAFVGKGSLKPEEKILSLYSCGMSQRDISEQIKNL